VQSVGFVLLVSALFAGKHLLHDFSQTCYLVSAAMVIVNLATVAFAAKVCSPEHEDPAPVPT
jgi:hypothetical protein